MSSRSRSAATRSSASTAASASSAQPQEAVASFRANLGDFPKARRIAIITGSAITRLQVKREMTQPYLRIFDDATAGLAWLLAPEAVEAEA